MADSQLPEILRGLKRVPRPSDATMRTIDFSYLPATMLVSTCLRRLWRVAPPDVQGTPADDHDAALEREVVEGIRKIRNEIELYHQNEWYDDEVWLERTDFDILDRVYGLSNDGEPQISLGTGWRHKIYRWYTHVFEDAHNILSSTDFNCGDYDPPEYKVLKIDFSSDGAASTTHEFETDCFLYPVWIDPECQLTFSTEGHEATFSSEGKTWTSVMWFFGGVSITITVQGGSSNERNSGLAALLVAGICQKNNFMQLEMRANPEYSQDAQGEWRQLDGAKQTVGFWPEGDYFARAVFLKAGNTLDRCTFDEELPEQPDQDPDFRSLSNVQEQVVATSLYQSLQGDDCLRILLIQPAGSSDELITSLMAVSLDEAPSYEALSYTWGDPSDKTVVKCNGHEVLVPNNLKAALKQLRYRDRPRAVWADSICINQLDLSERNQQVSIMRSIYRQAHQVLVWLGEDSSDHATDAFKAICEIVKSWMPKGERFKFARYTNALDPIHGEDIKSLREKVGSSEWQALQNMFRMPYFERSWVIQELALSRTATVFWGEHHIAWELVGVCSTWLITRGWFFSIDDQIPAAYNACLMYVLPLAQYSGISRFSKLGLSAVLGMMMDRFKSTDPRDRIYALLGMPFSGNDPDRTLLITPDYSEDTRSVYIKAARRMLETDKHLRILSAVQHGREIDASYPSWIPRWDLTPHSEPIAMRDESGYYSNGGELLQLTDQSFSSDGTRLVLRGLEVGKIDGISVEVTPSNLDAGSWEHGSDRAALLSILGELCDKGKQLRTTWNFGDERFVLPGFEDPKAQAEEIPMVSVASGIPGHYGMLESVEMQDGERARLDHLGELLLYWRERSSWDVSRLETGFRNRIKDDFEITVSALNLFPGRRIIHYGDGKFGLGPIASQPGDVIAVLFGGIVPYILRRLSENEYLLVGESFIPGLMQGEAVEAAGMFEEGRYARAENGMLQIGMVEGPGPDPRLGRNTGDYGIKEFVLC